MPHCWPQKQQCVFTKRSAGLRDSSCQPPGGVYAGCGPKRSRSDSSDTGALATRILLKLELRERERFSFARRAQFLPVFASAFHAVIESNLWKDALQIFDVHLRGKPLTAALAERRLSRFSCRLVELHTELSGTLENMEELSEWKIQQRSNHGDGVQNRQKTVELSAHPVLGNSKRKSRHGDRE